MEIPIVLDDSPRTVAHHPVFVDETPNGIPPPCPGLLPKSVTAWSNITPAPEDAVFKVARLYKECTDPKKADLGIGAYRGEDGKPLVLDAVVKAKAQLASKPPQTWTHEYQPITGHAAFLAAAQELAFGKEMRFYLGGRLVGLQTLSGTGACRLGFAFVRQLGASNVIYIPKQTWANHRALGKAAELEVREYRYIDESKVQTPQLDIEGMLDDLKAAPVGSTVLLHLCAHNPTGVDPTIEQWKKISEVIVSRQLLPFFDNAYQGFATGDLVGDAAALKMFIQMGLNPIVACSFAKNMGLFGERVGALHVVAPDAQSAQAGLSQLKVKARAMYSNPPQFGAQIAHMVMTNPELRLLWETELKGMSERIQKMRKLLRAKLEDKAKDQTWHHITDQIGMFSFTGLTKEQVHYCRKHGSVFMLDTGRISMAGLNEKNVEHVAAAMAESVQACK